MDLLDRLLGHDHWTTARLLNLSRGLTDAQLDQPFDIGHRTLRATFEHMISGVAFWTALMAGQPIDMPRDDRSSLTALVDRHERSYAAFAAFARRVRDEQLLDDTFVHPVTARETFGGTIIHVVLHNTQHRSEALHVLERLGVPDLPEGDPQEWAHETQGV
jgi:uncharacterized damage-inducible protein DinB